jgi:hypothetical protein
LPDEQDPMSGRCSIRALLALAILAWVALRVASIFTVAFNWDEFVLLDRTARQAADGFVRGGGHGGLSELLLAPLVAGCEDEIAVARGARAAWLFLTIAYLAGVAAVIGQLLKGRPGRAHDTALGVALLALLPVFLEWSLQVRTDHLALAAGAWGGAALLASRARPGFAVAAGIAFGVGSLSSQKLVYIAVLMGMLEAGRIWLAREWRPRREALRVGLVGVAVFGVTAIYRAWLDTHFTVPAQHPTSPVPDPRLVASYLGVFDFYRATIGWSQYRALLPTLAPHACLTLLLAFATTRAVRARTLDPRLVLAWVTLAAGLVVALFHAAAFSYFWLTLGIFPAIGLALAVGPVREALPERWLRTAAALLWIGLVLPAALQATLLLRDTQQVQRQSLAFVRDHFPRDTAGFHPETAAFCGEQPLGTWLSHSIYRRFGGPDRSENARLFANDFRRKQVHYLLNSFRLNQFPVEMRRFWTDNYQPYHASVFVAGRRFAGERGDRVPFELIAPGTYRWVPTAGPHAIVIDDVRVEPGALIALEASAHLARLPEDLPGGVLVLALDAAPTPSPLAFYKPY